MKKRRLSLILSAFLAVGTLLSSCSKESATQSGNGSENQPYEIKWYTLGTPQKDTEKVFEEVNKYTKEKINATVKMTQIDWGDWDQKSQVMINSGEEFDIIFTFGNNYVQNAQKGAFLAIDDLLEKEGKALKDLINPVLLEGNMVDGKLYGIPANKEVAKQNVYTFNKRLVDKYKFDLSKVKTLQDLEPMLKIIKENESAITPIATFMAPVRYDIVFNGEMPFAFPFEGKTDKVINHFETDDAMKQFKTMHEYYKAGYLKEDAAVSKENWPMDVENWFVRMGYYQPYAELLWSREAEYEVVSIPAEPAAIVNDSVSGSIQAISATSKNPQKAMDFLTLLNTDPYLRNLIDKGIEGTHYTKNEDGTIEDLPARIEGYNIPSYTLGNNYILDLYKGDPKDKWDKFVEFNDSAVRGPSLGFKFTSDPVRSELAAITNITKEFYPAIATGSVDPEKYLPKFNKKLKEAGVDKVLTEIQKQFDEWKSTQK